MRHIDPGRTTPQTRRHRQQAPRATRGCYKCNMCPKSFHVIVNFLLALGHKDVRVCHHLEVVWSTTVHNAAHPLTTVCTAL
jgi:hypothetical protein